MCRILFFILFSACTFKAFGEISDTALRNICLSASEQDRRKCTFLKGNAQLVRELFEYAQSRTKIFLVMDGNKSDSSFYHLYEMFFGYYIIDTETGALVDVKDIKSFNNVMCDKKNKVPNLEISYLYLLLNHIGHFGINDMHQYLQEIQPDTSVLHHQGLFSLQPNDCSTNISDILKLKITNDVKRSTNNKIHVYTTLNKDDKFSVCRYTFRFGRRKHLKSVSAKTF